MSRTFEAAENCIREMVKMEAAGKQVRLHIDALAARHGLNRYQVMELAGIVNEMEVVVS